MGRHLQKFILLIWKNLVLQWRHPVQTAFEILAPVLFACLLVYVRSLVEPVKHSAINYSYFHSDRAPRFTTILPWAPRNPMLQEIMEETIKVFHAKPFNMPFLAHQSFENTEQLNNYLKDESDAQSNWAGIDFGDHLIDKDRLPENISITIRYLGELRQYNFLYNSWETNHLFPVYQTAGPREYLSNAGAYPKYNKEGFLSLQQQLSYSIIDHLKQQEHGQKFTKSINLIRMKRFDYPEWTSDVLIQALQSFVGMIFMLSFVYTCINTVKVITTEKEKQLKEAMKIMGLPGWLHWTAWFIKTFAYLLISIAVMVILLKIPWYPGTNHTLFTYSDPLVIFIFLMTFVAATITFCFAISVFFSRATTAATVAGMMWFISYFPYALLQQSYDTLSLSQKLTASLLSNTAMAYGFQLILMFEGNEEGLQWDNIWSTITPDENLVFGHIIMMLIIDTVIYLLVALYVEAVFPGDYGVPQVWYYPFTKSYWCGTSNDTYDGCLEEFLIENGSYEKEPQHLKAGIKIKNLRKEFANKKIAVKDLSLNMYQDQITVLLGHNGAGKTTTMSILTGMFTPTHGTAIVNDYDIRKNMNGVRESLGLCPQHNVLFDDLTVSEHLYFFCRLKGLSKSEANAETLKYVDLLELKPKANSHSSTLSGGMKRKLSVAIALCGDSSVVMCDEPTAGMDPSARRALWDLLQSQKKGRTILLTTHFMDEADLLGDRIAIMAEGELQCCGSSFFLKKKYGAGYHLIMDTSSKCIPKEVTALLKKYIANIEVESHIGSELTYILNEEHAQIFETMLFDLETHSRELGINTYGISLTTLEEVFMKVGASHHETKEIDTDQYQVPSSWDNNDSRVYIENKLLGGVQLWFNQILAMAAKRGLSIIRSWGLLLIQNLIPVLFLSLAIISVRNDSSKKDLPNLKIDLNSYNDPKTVITYKDSNKYTDAYKEILKKSNNEIIDWKDGDMNKLMVEETRKHTSLVRSRYIVGADFAEEGFITAFFNNNPLHSPALAMQMALNAILHTEVDSKYSIEFNNFPLPFSTKTMLTGLGRGSSSGFTIGFNLAFSMAFSSAFYIMFYVRERVCKSKHLQFVSGIRVLPFWCTAFVVDLITFIFTALVVIITFAIFQEDGFKTGKDLGTIFVIFLYFAVSTLPMMYLASYLFDIPSTGYTRMALFNVLVGIAGFIGVHVISQPELELVELANTLHWILLFVPQYSFSAGVRDMNLIFTTHHLCNKARAACVANGASPLECRFAICAVNSDCCKLTKDYFDIEKPGIGRNVIISCAMSLVFIAILLAIEYRLFDKIKLLLSKKLPPPTDELNEDDDVAQEKKLIRNLPFEKIQNYKLVMRDVTKYYNKFLAVNSICLGIKQQECFGLLGVNGAGKTTTFKMLTGDLPLSHGDAWVHGYNLKTQMKSVHQLIGYCPQFDALLDDLTARETLVLYGVIRGIGINQSKIEARHLAQKFDFSQHLDKQIKALSGGNKRKVSTALALIGDPEVIYLDEPTTGMDPATKRYLWNALCQVRDTGKCIVLTSHSMEECEALCTRLSIMVNGAFCCLGSTQHLKNKFSEGYTLTIKIKKTDTSGDVLNRELDSIEKFVTDNFGNVTIREKHQELITFYIADMSQPWSKMFGILERGRKHLHIEDYSLGQSSLEQVFLTFIKQQR